MSWQLLIAISILLYSVAVLIQRVVLQQEKSDPKAYSVFFQIITGLIIGVLGFAFSDMSLPYLRPLIPNLILTTLFYGFGNIFVFKALKVLEVSKFVIILSARALFTILASSLLLNESLSPSQLLGTFFIFIGIILVNTQSAKFTFSKNEFLVLAAAALFGLGTTNDRFLLLSFNVYPYLFLAFLLPGLFITALYPSVIKKIPLILDKKTFSKVLTLCSLYAAAAVTFFMALQIADNSSQVMSVNISGVIVTVFMAVIFLKETQHLPQKLLGAVSSFIGLFLVT